MCLLFTSVKNIFRSKELLERYCNTNNLMDDFNSLNIFIQQTDENKDQNRDRWNANDLVSTYF